MLVFITLKKKKEKYIYISKIKKVTKKYKNVKP